MQSISTARKASPASELSAATATAPARMALLLACLAIIGALFAAASPHAAYASAGDLFSASSGTSDGAPVEIGTSLTFKVISEPSEGQPGSVQVGNGASCAFDPVYEGAITVPEYVSNDGATYEVEQCAYASFWLSNVSAVSLPSTLQRICSYSFYCCYNLAHVDFQGEPHIAYIEGHAFEVPNASGALEHMRFPSSLLSIGVYSFAGQASLRELAFEGDSLQFIGQYAFSNCKGLVEIHVPELTNERNSFGAYAFSGCSNLEFAEFLGNIESTPNELIGTRYFDDCVKLSTIVYRGKKAIPTWKYYGSSTDLFSEFTASSPTLYYTVTYYGSRDDAEAERDPLGAACVRFDTPIGNIGPSMARSDEVGAVVFDGEPLAPPEGFDAWQYEGEPLIDSIIEDSIYAYPVDSHDLSNASVSLEAESFPYTSLPVSPAPTVISATGSVLEPDVDYEVRYERQGADYLWKDDEERIDIGSMRVVVTGLNAYAGSHIVPFEIAHAEAGDTFVSEGVTYTVTTPTDGSFVGEASVGDGKEPAIPTDTEGTLEIPETVCPDESLISYKVTAVGNRAFGSGDTDGACTKLESVILPDGVKTLGTYAFGYCSKLKAMKLPASIETIGSRAFQNCVKLSDLQFEGDSIKQFGTYCFAFCTSLSQVELPSAQIMRDNVFHDCGRLARVDFLGRIDQGDATQFSGCKRLSRAVFHVADAWEGSFPGNTAVYAIATFKDAKGKVLGSATLRIGTPFTSISPKISTAYLLEGSVPAMPSGFGIWTTKNAGDKKFSDCSTLVPRGVKKGKAAVGGSGASKASYKVISNSAFTVSYEAPKTGKAQATIPATVKLNGCTYDVIRVAAKAFAKTKVTAVTVKSKNIKTFKNAFRTSKVKTVKAPKSKKAKYTKLLKKSACGKSVKVSWV